MERILWLLKNKKILPFKTILIVHIFLKGLLPQPFLRGKKPPCPLSTCCTTGQQPVSDGWWWLVIPFYMEVIVFLDWVYLLSSCYHRGDADSAASALTLQDCPDIDHRETISLVSTCNLMRYFSTRFLLFVWKWHWIIVIFFHIFNLLLQLKKTELTEKEMTRLTDLCLFWDLPVPSSSNQDWLFQQLLSHAVSFAVLFV